MMILVLVSSLATAASAQTPILACMEEHCMSEGLACFNDAGCKAALDAFPTSPEETETKLKALENGRGGERGDFRVHMALRLRQREQKILVSALRAAACNRC